MSVTADGTDPLAGLPRWRLLLLVAFLAGATYANAVGNGWAFDDDLIVVGNPDVTEARWAEVFGGAWWEGHEAPPALYRPTAEAALALQWRIFGDSPAAFHAVNLVLHALVSVLVTLLAASFLPATAAAAGGALFAVHPVHVEAVANGVGQAEILAAAAYLGACLLFLLRPRGGSRRALRLVGVVALYGIALGAKEISVTLPAVLLLLEGMGARRGAGGARTSLRVALADSLRRDAPLHLAVAATLVAYLVIRVWVLGSLRGEIVPAELADLSWSGRLFTALSLWPIYLRLLLFPFDLSVDYAPGVHVPATGMRADVLFGALLLSALCVVAGRGRARMPWAALAAGWLLVTILPVSNLVIPAGTLLAERTLYLPSVAVAVALAAAGGLAWLARRHPGALRPAWVAVAVVATAFLVRSTARNPTWMSTYTVMNTLAVEHPESWRSYRSRGTGLVQVGDLEGALREYDKAVALLPGDYALLCEAGALYKRARLFPRAEQLLASAIEVAPDRPLAYRLLAELYLIAGDGRNAHRVALAGLSRWGSDRDLWAVVSESYVAKGDLDAAVRAREAALGADPASSRDRARLAELVEAAGSPPGTHLRGEPR